MTPPIHVFCAVPLPAHVDSALRAAFAVTSATGTDPFGELDRLAAMGERFDAIVTSIGCPPLNARAIARLPESVRIIATYSVGTDHIDIEAARQRGLAVSNTPGALTDAVADAALFLILGAARRGTESIALIRSQAWPGWYADQLLGYELNGRRLGIYGMGEIGVAVAKRARAFGMDIAYCNRRPAAGADALFIANRDELVSSSDVLLLTAPSTQQTRGFINETTLGLAKRSMILVNVARGDLIEDAALIEALRERRIFAAALDVFDNEPQINPGYYDLHNLFMTPHIGSSTVEARAAMGASVIRSIRAVVTGENGPLLLK